MNGCFGNNSFLLRQCKYLVLSLHSASDIFVLFYEFQLKYTLGKYLNIYSII